MQICSCFLLFLHRFIWQLFRKYNQYFFYICCSHCLRMCVFFCTFAAEFNYSMALTRTYYRVAEHLFAVECGDSALLQCMTNYEPFREPTPNPSLNAPHDAGVIGDPANGRELGEEIFTLRVEGDEAKGKVQGARGERLEARGEEWTHVLTDNAEEDMPRIEVYKASGGWLLRVAMVAKAPISCEIECNEDFTEGVLYITDDCQDVRFCIDNALMLLFAFRTAPLMTLEMHAAVVVKAYRLKHPTTQVSSGTPHAVRCQTAALLDRPSGLIDPQELGYLFLGHSGTGKSTHARMWLEAFEDAWLLNDDNPILRVMEDGEVRVYGSPWSGKTPCYNNAYARVGGIVKLSQAPHNKIRTLSLPEAYAYMLSSASGLKMEKQMADCMYETIKHVITHVKCYHLACLPNTEAAEVAQRGMV